MNRFWLALYAPRNPTLDALAPHPFVRKLVFRLPAFLQPGPAKHSWVLALDLDGKVAAHLQYAGSGAYAPITSVRESDGTQYFGSPTEPAIGRRALKALRR